MTAINRRDVTDLRDQLKAGEAAAREMATTYSLGFADGLHRAIELIEEVLLNESGDPK